jgi:hypothetical protein
MKARGNAKELKDNSVSAYRHPGQRDNMCPRENHT